MISVITPVYKESLPLLHSTLGHLIGFKKVSEIIVVMTQSDPQAAELNRQVCAHYVDNPRVLTTMTSKAGRATQMNHGVKLAKSKNLLFIHADSTLPTAADQSVLSSLKTSSWGRFDLKLDDPRPVFKIIAWFINRRSALTQICTGDQALFMTRDFFKKVGGFPEQELMEDIEFSSRAKKFTPPAVIKNPVVTSARRWQQHGVIKTVVLMWRLRALYWFGVPPEKLARRYRQAR